MEQKPRILTGMRPTGPLHLGHYVGALENWITLQEKYACYFLIADYQALGDYSDDIPRIRQSVIDVTLDWLAVGQNPNDHKFVIQSYIPEHAELAMLLGTLVTLPRLHRNPTLKGEMDQQKASDITVAFYTYPVSQVADILLPKAHLVPVGEDQMPHIELTREVARKFNRTYEDIFPEPKGLVGRIPRLVGIDGQAKMSKSLDNAIYLSDDKETVNQKVRRMFTDPTRLRATDPGHVENNPVFMYHDAFNTDHAQLEDLKTRYRAGRVGDVEVKNILAEHLNNFLDPIREKRHYYEKNPSLVRDALLQGTNHAKILAEETMREVRESMGIKQYV